MNPTYVETAMSNAALGTLGAFIGALVVVAALMWAVRLGIRLRRRESDPPKPHEHPRMPEGGPTYEHRRCGNRMRFPRPRTGASV